MNLTFARKHAGTASACHPEGRRAHARPALTAR